MWTYIYGQIKGEIWIKMCEEVIEIEKRKGITQKNKRKKEDLGNGVDSQVDELENDNKKNKNS